RSATIAIHNPQIAAVAEGDLRAADGGLAQQQSGVAGLCLRERNAEQERQEQQGEGEAANKQEISADGHIASRYRMDFAHRVAVNSELKNRSVRLAAESVPQEKEERSREAVMRGVIQCWIAKGSKVPGEKSSPGAPDRSGASRPGCAPRQRVRTQSHPLPTPQRATRSCTGS